MGLFCQSSERSECPVGDFIVSETQEHVALFSFPNSVIICPSLSKIAMVYAGCQGVINKSALTSVPIWKIKYIVTLC